MCNIFNLWYQTLVVKLTYHKIITVLGSTKFRKEITAWAWEKTKEGNLMLFAPFAKEEMDEVESNRDMLESQHFQKITLADEIFVFNKGGYIGDSTKKEIRYAKKEKKMINYLEEPYKHEYNLLLNIFKTSKLLYGKKVQLKKRVTWVGTVDVGMFGEIELQKDDILTFDRINGDWACFEEIKLHPALSDVLRDVKFI